MTSKRGTSKRKILQPAALQLERVQSDEYDKNVLGRNLFQPAAQLSNYVTGTTEAMFENATSFNHALHAPWYVVEQS